MYIRNDIQIRGVQQDPLLPQTCWQWRCSIRRDEDPVGRAGDNPDDVGAAVRVHGVQRGARVALQRQDEHGDLTSARVDVQHRSAGTGGACAVLAHDLTFAYRGHRRAPRHTPRGVDELRELAQTMPVSYTHLRAHETM